MKSKWRAFSRPRRVLILAQGALILLFLILYAARTASGEPLGDWIAFGMGAFCSLACACSALFAEGLFHLRLSFRIKDPDRAEPSRWTRRGWWVQWIICAALALACFIMGLMPDFNI